MSGEKLELVTRFEDLRAGMLVVLVDPCCVCGRRNARGILLQRAAVPMFRTRGWFWAPGHGHDGPFSGIGEPDVDRRVVYRVVDPDADRAETTETEKPRKLVKT